jgi:hypothetical protein
MGVERKGTSKISLQAMFSFRTVKLNNSNRSYLFKAKRKMMVLSSMEDTRLLCPSNVTLLE